ncbi:hypothetical protein HY612_04925 [Candidatus Roizmanbacteria bacterium]|nr:hypothetical protein [Candidatus Roizmanbacteria bacterium]
MLYVNNETGQAVSVNRLNKDVHDGNNLKEKERIEKLGHKVTSDGRLQTRLALTRAIGGANHRDYGLTDDPDFISFTANPPEGCRAVLISCSDGFVRHRNVVGSEEFLKKKYNEVIKENPQAPHGEIIQLLLASARKEPVNKEKGEYVDDIVGTGVILDPANQNTIAIHNADGNGNLGHEVARMITNDKDGLVPVTCKILEFMHNHPDDPSNKGQPSPELEKYLKSFQKVRVLEEAISQAAKDNDERLKQNQGFIGIRRYNSGLQYALRTVVHCCVQNNTKELSTKIQEAAQDYQITATELPELMKQTSYGNEFLVNRYQILSDQEQYKRLLDYIETDSLAKTQDIEKETNQATKDERFMRQAYKLLFTTQLLVNGINDDIKKPADVMQMLLDNKTKIQELLQKNISLLKLCGQDKIAAALEKISNHEPFCKNIESLNSVKELQEKVYEAKWFGKSQTEKIAAKFFNK